MKDQDKEAKKVDQAALKQQKEVKKEERNENNERMEERLKKDGELHVYEYDKKKDEDK